jgi:hypothetical protein
MELCARRIKPLEGSRLWFAADAGPWIGLSCPARAPATTAMPLTHLRATAIFCFFTAARQQSVMGGKLATLQKTEWFKEN